MRIGETVEFALWADGTERPEVLAQFDADVREAFRAVAMNHSVILGPVKRGEKRPGEERVPHVPKHIAGPNVRLLVAEAVVLCRAPRWRAANSNGFLAELEPNDLARLRAVTRAAYAQRFPKQGPLTDRQCDTLISDLGPGAAVDALRAGQADLARVLH